MATSWTGSSSGPSVTRLQGTSAGRGGVLDGDRRPYPATRRKGAGDRHPARLARSHEVVEDLVGHRFVEDALVPELEQVVLQGLQLEAEGVGHVVDHDLSEVGQPRLRAHRRE